MDAVQNHHTAHSHAAAARRFTPGETYYRHRETHVLYGKGMVQTNWKPPELEELIATDETTLVPVNNARAQTAAQGAAHVAKPRTPPRSVPRFDASKRELEYEFNPQTLDLPGQSRPASAEELAAAHAQAEAHAEATRQATEAQLNAVTQAEQAELNARALHAQQAAQAAAGSAPIAPLTPTPLQPPGAPAAVNPLGEVTTETGPAPLNPLGVDLTTLGGLGNAGQ